MCMGRSGGANPGGAPTRPSPEGPGVFTAVLDGRALFEAGAASPEARQQAVAAFRKSLDIRKGRSRSGGAAPDAGHQSMIDEMETCIERIEAMDREDQRAQAAHGH